MVSAGRTLHVIQNWYVYLRLDTVLETVIWRLYNIIDRNKYCDSCFRKHSSLFAWWKWTVLKTAPVFKLAVKYYLFKIQYTSMEQVLLWARHWFLWRGDLLHIRNFFKETICSCQVKALFYNGFKFSGQLYREIFRMKSSLFVARWRQWFVA